MNVLYKYCDLKGIKILESLELKLPYISDVNDPLECMPFLFCPDDKSAIEAKYLSVLQKRNMAPPINYEQALDDLYSKGEIQKGLSESSRRTQDNWNQKNCLLSVSKAATNTVMWAHYSALHKGVVIGIDFDCIFPDREIQMDDVNYSDKRPIINILTDFEMPPEAFLKTILTKSSDWAYEQELRAVISNSNLVELEKQGFACFKEFNGKMTWFLKLQPQSIKEVIFGLDTKDSLKLAIKELIKKTELQHIQLYQAKESETYTLGLDNIDI